MTNPFLKLTALSGLVKLKLNNMNKSEIIAAIQALVAVISCKTVKSDVIEKANDKISYLISLL